MVGIGLSQQKIRLNKTPFVTGGENYWIEPFKDLQQSMHRESDAGTAKQTKERLSPSELKFENSRV